MRVHVITAGKHGSTHEIGEAIAERLRGGGFDARAERAEGLSDLEPGEPVVLGSPIYMGKWVKAARKVADRLATEPAGRDLWMFTVGPLGDPPEPVDARPEEQIESLAAERAIDHKIFTGKLDRSQLNFAERLAIKVVKAPDGDFRDWDAINAWADQISAHLVARDDRAAQENARANA